MITIYQAGPLFTESEQRYHRHLKGMLASLALTTGRELAIVWPFELFTPEGVEAWGGDAKLHIFQGCRAALESSDIVVALIDGTQVDDGTAWEIGYAHALHKPILGLRTDQRHAGDCAGSVVNAMIECSCASISRSIDDLLEEMEKLLRAYPISA